MDLKNGEIYWIVELPEPGEPMLAEFIEWKHSSDDHPVFQKQPLLAPGEWRILDDQLGTVNFHLYRVIQHVPKPPL